MILKNLILKSEICNNETIITIDKKDLLLVFNFLKYHTETSYQQLMSITAIDYPTETERFVVVYQLLSITYNKRLRIKVSTDELTPLESLSELYSSAGWYEREIWDMFGIFFLNNRDLRRILNDYGFVGHPLRKDFPLTGYYQVRYDEEKKRIISEPVELAQQSRVFSTQINPWTPQ